MPGTEIGVDVISGRVYMATEVDLLPKGYGPPEGLEGVIGVVDPQFHHLIFAYRNNAIPGYEAWKPRFGKAPAPAPGPLPVWTRPHLVAREGRPVAVVLADGRRVTFSTDLRGRIIGVRSETTRREPLLTTITYRRGVTTIAAPAGVTRNYHYNRRDRITEVDASGAATHARQDTVNGILDSPATWKRLQYRLRSGTAERYAAYRVALNAIGDNTFAWPSVDGYQQYGVTTLAQMRRVDDSLRASGVLDVAEAIPILNNRVENYSQEKAIERISAGIHGCDIGYPEYGFTYGLNTTPAEIATIAARLAHGPNRWIYIYYSKQRSFCAKAD
jgi:YD repeat-containing protein